MTQGPGTALTTGGRIASLDFARVAAMLAVVTIHVTSTYLDAASGYLLLGRNLAFYLNQITRSSVPLFLLLSGLSLGLAQRPMAAGAFYRRRLSKIGLPYLFWFAVYFLFEHRGALGEVEPGALVRSLLMGQAAPHLYFIVILIQLYLLYPLLRRAVARWPWATLLVAAFVTYAIGVLYLFERFDTWLIPWQLRPYLWILFPTWAFYFVAGQTIAARCLPALERFTRRAAPAILAVGAAAAVLYGAESAVTGRLDAIKPELMAFTVLALLCAMSFWTLIGRWGWARRSCAFLADHAMTIYFGHVLGIYILRRFPVFHHGMSGMLLLWAATVALSIPAAWLFDAVTRRLGRALRRGK